MTLLPIHEAPGLLLQSLALHTMTFKNVTGDKSGGELVCIRSESLLISPLVPC